MPRSPKRSPWQRKDNQRSFARCGYSSRPALGCRGRALFIWFKCLIVCSLFCCCWHRHPSIRSACCLATPVSNRRPQVSPCLAAMSEMLAGRLVWLLCPGFCAGAARPPCFVRPLRASNRSWYETPDNKCDYLNQTQHNYDQQAGDPIRRLEHENNCSEEKIRKEKARTNNANRANGAPAKHPALPRVEIRERGCRFWKRHQMHAYHLSLFPDPTVSKDPLKKLLYYPPSRGSTNQKKECDSGRLFQLAQQFSNRWTLEVGLEEVDMNGPGWRSEPAGVYGGKTSTRESHSKRKRFRGFIMRNRVSRRKCTCDTAARRRDSHKTVRSRYQSRRLEMYSRQVKVETFERMVF